MVQQGLRYKAYLIATISLLLLVGLVAFTRTRLKKTHNDISQSGVITPSVGSLSSDIKPTETKSTTNQTNSTNVSVNGQSITVPANGSTHQTIPSENGQTEVDISNDSGGNGTNQSHSSTQVNINSRSSAETFSSNN